MKRIEMDAIVREDRKHIGQGAHGTPQKMMRGIYWNGRRSQLGSKGDPSPSREDVFCQAVATTRERHPDFDHQWFGDLE